MPFRFRLYEPEADVSFLSIVDGEALFNGDDDSVGRDAREATLQQIGWHTVRLPEQWFLGEQHHHTANRVLETMQCTIQYTHHCQRKAEKALRKATKTLTRYQEERDDAFEEVVTLRETLALYKKRLSVAQNCQQSGPTSTAQRAGDRDGHTEGLLCSLCGNEYPSVHSLESHIKKRHKRHEEFASLAACSAAVAHRSREAGKSGTEPCRAETPVSPSSRLVGSLTAEVSALRLQVAKLMEEAADQRQAFGPAHLVAMPLGTLPGQPSVWANGVQRDSRSAASRNTEDYLQRMTESLEAATAKMADMEKTIASLQHGDRQAVVAKPGLPPALQSSHSSLSGVLGALPSAVVRPDSDGIAGHTSASTRRGGRSAQTFLLSPNSLSQRRPDSVATADWDVDVSPMTQLDLTPRGSPSTRRGSVTASRASADGTGQQSSVRMVPPPVPSLNGVTRRPLGSTASSVRSATQTGGEAPAGADSATVAPLAQGGGDASVSLHEDTTTNVDGDQSDVVLTARRPSSSQTDLVVAPPLMLSTIRAAAHTVPTTGRDRYGLTPGEALSTSMTPRGAADAHGESARTDDGGDHHSPPATHRGHHPPQSTTLHGGSPARYEESSHTSVDDSSSSHPRTSAEIQRAREAGGPLADGVPADVDASLTPHHGPDLSLSADSRTHVMAPSLDGDPASPYSVPSLVQPGTSDADLGRTPPRVLLVNGSESATPTLNDTSDNHTPHDDGRKATSPTTDIAEGNSPAAASSAPGLLSPTVFASSLPQSKDNRRAHQPDSPLAWHSSGGDSDRLTPPPLSAATPLRPPDLASGLAGATLISTVPSIKLPTMGHRAARENNTEDATVERREAGARNRSRDRDGAAGDSGSYSYYYTYSTTPSDAKTGSSSPATGHSATEERGVAGIARSRIRAQEATPLAPQQNEDAPLQRVKGVFKSLFASKKKRSRA